MLFDCEIEMTETSTKKCTSTVLFHFYFHKGKILSKWDLKQQDNSP